MVKRDPYRVISFELVAGEEDILFKPKSIDMRGGDYPGYLKETYASLPSLPLPPWLDARTNTHFILLSCTHASLSPTHPLARCVWQDHL